MKHLWSPWRLEYVQSPEKKKTKAGGCIFCSLLEEEDSFENLILYRDKDLYIILNRYPYNNGHLMIIPCRHVGHLKDLKADEIQKLMLWTQACLVVLESEFSAQGFNVGMNVGEAAGAGIAPHLHQHIVPRWAGDTNFMPVLGEIKCIPDHLKAAYDRLKEPVIKEVRARA